jgi:hypothetical protein
MTIQLKPEFLWGDFNVPSWKNKDNNMLAVKLLGVSSAIIYAEQAVINRVTSCVEDLLNRAKSEELTAEEVLKLVDKKALFSEEELETIEKNAETQAEMMGEFFKNNGAVN